MLRAKKVKSRHRPSYDERVRYSGSTGDNRTAARSVLSKRHNDPPHRKLLRPVW